MKFAALGRTQWLYDGILAAVAAGHQPALIGTCPAAPEYAVDQRDFKKLAKEIGCPFFCALEINEPEYLAMARSSGAEVAISVNWKTLIRAEMLGAFRHGILNAHAGDLPRYRGNAAPNWAILNGEKEVTLTLHRMTEELDAGPILIQRRYPLKPTTYIGEVYTFLRHSIPQIFVEAIAGLAAGTIVLRDQPKDPLLSLRCFPRLPEDGLIDWARPAEEIARLVRASAEPFAGAYTYLQGKKLVIWRARPERLPYPYVGIPGQVAQLRHANGEVTVLTGDGVLVLEEISLGRHCRCRAAEILNSARIRLGLSLGRTQRRIG